MAKKALSTGIFKLQIKCFMVHGCNTVTHGDEMRHEIDISEIGSFSQFLSDDLGG